MGEHFQTWYYALQMESSVPGMGRGISACGDVNKGLQVLRQQHGSDENHLFSQWRA
jgi:hypothetical protein